MMKEVNFYIDKQRGLNIPDLDLHNYTNEQRKSIERTVSDTAIRDMIYDDTVEGTVVVSEPSEIKIGISPVQMVKID